MQLSQEFNRQEDIDYYIRRQESLKSVSAALNNSSISTSDRINLEEFFESFFNAEYRKSNSHITLLMEKNEALIKEIETLNQNSNSSTIENSEIQSYNKSIKFTEFSQNISIQPFYKNTLIQEKDKIIEESKREAEAIKNENYELRNTLTKYEYEIEAFKNKKKSWKSKNLNVESQKLKVSMQSNQDELFPSFVEEEHYNPKTAEIIEKEICIKTFENLLSENEQNIKTLTDLIDDKDKLLSDLNNKMIILKNQKDELSEKTTENESKNKSLNETISKIENDYSCLKKTLDDVLAEKLLASKNFEQEKSKLIESLDQKINSKEIEFNSNLEQFIIKFEEVSSKNEKLKSENEKLNKTIADLDQSLSKLNLISEKSNLELKRIEVEKQELLKAKTEDKKKLKLLDDVYNRVNSQYEREKLLLGNKTQEVSNLENKLKQKAENIKQLKDENDRLSNIAEENKKIKDENHRLKNVELACENVVFQRNNEFLAFRGVFYNLKGLVQELLNEIFDIDNLTRCLNCGSEIKSGDHCKGCQEPIMLKLQGYY